MWWTERGEASVLVAHQKARVARLDRVRERMAEEGIEALLLSLGADLPWLTGYEAMPLERPTVLVVPGDDRATLLVPRLEVPRVVPDEALFDLCPWGETEDPVARAATLVGRRTRLAISDRAFASLLLGLSTEMPQATWRPASQLIGPLRARKDPLEIAALEAAGRAADAVARALVGGDVALIGRSEAEVSVEIGARLRAEGHSRVSFAIVASGPNAASPHHEPGNRLIGPGEAVVCDFGGVFHLDGDAGYCSDVTRTLSTGAPDRALADLYEVLEAAQAAALGGIKAGMSCESLDLIARDIITDAGYGQYFVHRTGHGIGIEEHEDPYIVAGNSDPIAVGHAFSVEPGIYLPRSTGARIEDIVVVAADGAHPVTTTARHLAIVEA